MASMSASPSLTRPATGSPPQARTEAHGISGEMDRWLRKQASDGVDVTSHGHCSGSKLRTHILQCPSPRVGTAGRDSLLTNRMGWKQGRGTSEIPTDKAVAPSSRSWADCSPGEAASGNSPAPLPGGPRGQEPRPPPQPPSEPRQSSEHLDLPATSKGKP